MRTQSKSAISYMFRNFWGLILFAAVPAVLLGFFSNESGRVNFVLGVFNGTVTKENFLFGLLYAFSILRFGKFWWVALIALVSFIVAESFMLVRIGRHMKLGVRTRGERTLRSSVSFLPRTAVFTLMFFLLSELLNLIVIGLSHLLSDIVSNTYVFLAAVTAFSAVGEVLLCIFFCMLICTLPSVLGEEYKLNIAMSYSVRLMSGHKASFFVYVTVLYCCTRLAALLSGVLLAPFDLEVIVQVLFFLFWIIYTPCLAFRTYYDRTDGERRDLSRVMFG